MKNINELFNILKKNNIELKIGDKFKDKKFGDSEIEIFNISTDKKNIRVKFNIIQGESSFTHKKYEISTKELFKNYEKII